VCSGLESCCYPLNSEQLWHVMRAYVPRNPRAPIGRRASSHMSAATSGVRSCLLDPDSFTSFTLGVSVTMVGTGLAATATTTSFWRCVLFLCANCGTNVRPARAPLACRLRGACEQPLLSWASPRPCIRADTMALPACGPFQHLAAGFLAWGQSLGAAGCCSSLAPERALDAC
jgi:hypothetical protein